MSQTKLARLDSLGRVIDGQGSAVDVDDGPVRYHVILLAGQSNTVGKGLPIEPAYFDQGHPRIYQFANSGSYQGQIVQAVEPLRHYRVTNPPGIGYGVSFARQYLRTLRSNEMVLLVPVASGGTGFTTTTETPAPPGKVIHIGGGWDVNVGGVNLCQNAVNQANAALAAAAEAPDPPVFAGILWHQGEADEGLTTAQYAAYWDELIAALRDQITAATPDTPVVVGQMVPGYIALRSAIGLINTAHVEAPYRNTRVAFAYGPATGSTNIHYTAAEQRLLARSMWEAWPRALANVLGVAAPVPQVTLTQSGTSLLVRWQQPEGRVTDYNVRYKLSSDSTWTDLTRSRSLEVAMTITSLTLGSAYDVQVRSVNEQGASAWATVSITLLTLPAQVTGVATGTPGSRAVPLSWSPAARATSYVVEISPEGEDTWTVAGTTTSTSITVGCPSPLTAYDFRVIAENAAGSAAPSDVVTETTGDPIPLIDDVGSQAARAYGLRLLRGLHTGPAIRVRRSNDNAEQDIGFESPSGALDTTALLAFAGSNSAYIKTWYDQSGNGLNLTNSNTAQQARIVNAGTVEVANGKPAAAFLGTSFYQDANASLYDGGQASALMVYKASTTGATQNPWSEGYTGSNNPQYIQAYLSSGDLLAWQIRDLNAIVLVATTTTLVAVDGTTKQLSSVDTGSEMMGWIDSTGPHVAAYRRDDGPHTFNFNVFSFGARIGSSTTSQMAGQIGELVLFPVALEDAPREAGEGNQQDYYLLTS